MSRSGAIAFVWLQRILPKYLLTAIVYRLARVRLQPVKDWLIRRFVGLYDVDLQELEQKVPDDYATFNDFFTRELSPGQRPVDPAAEAIVSPVDGTVSACGSIARNMILQAKGRHYSLQELLATDLQEADEMIDGSFLTAYLAPFNYHRVHCPIAAELVAVRYVPGDLFSVNDATVTHLPRLFARNERLICRFESTAASMILIFVGAMHVGSISTKWTGEIRPRRKGVVRDFDPGAFDRTLSVVRGGLLGWFNMGSTVIVLLPPGRCRWRPDMLPGRPLRVGEAIGTMAGRPQ